MLRLMNFQYHPFLKYLRRPHPAACVTRKFMPRLPFLGIEGTCAAHRPAAGWAPRMASAGVSRLSAGTVQTCYQHFSHKRSLHYPQDFGTVAACHSACNSNACGGSRASFSTSHAHPVPPRGRLDPKRPQSIHGISTILSTVPGWHIHKLSTGTKPCFPVPRKPMRCWLIFPFIRHRRSLYNSRNT